MASRKRGCISHANILNFWQISWVNRDEVFYEVDTCRDLLSKVATATERAVGGTSVCGHAKPSVSTETANFSGSTTCRSGLHCTMPWSAICYHGTLPSPTRLALTFPYRTVPDSKACEWSPYNLMRCQMASTARGSGWSTQKASPSRRAVTNCRGIVTF